MRVAIVLPYAAGNLVESAGRLPEYEKADATVVYVSEAYSYDAVSQLGYIAAKSTTLELASDILPVYTRTPTLTAVTAAGLGGMGANGQHFYHELIARYGYVAGADQIQELELAGHKKEAAAAVPRDLIGSISLIGSHKPGSRANGGLCRLRASDRPCVTGH